MTDTTDPQPEQRPPVGTAELASLAANAGRALADEKRHYEIACQENARLRAVVERVRRLHDALDAETDLASPGDEITRGAAARKIAAALDGHTPPAPAAVPSAPVARAALRDRIRRVLCDRDGQDSLWGTDMLEPDEYGADADAVLAVLPEPADRAAILREAADALVAVAGQHPEARAVVIHWGDAAALLRTMAQEECDELEAQAHLDELADDLYRMADEAQQPETQAPVRVETLARLLCDADNTLTDGPGWDQLSQTPGLGRDEYRNAARYLLRRVTVTQTLDGPAPMLCGDQIPDMACTLPDGPHDDWKHRDEEGHWWSQMRVPPHSNRDRIAAEQAAAAQQPKEA